MADPKSAGLKALLGTADALWPIILGVEVSAAAGHPCAAPCH